MTAKIDKHVLDNGMVILAEPLEAVRSAAFDFMIPAGSSSMPEGCCGAANLINEWIFRGAGGLDNRTLGDKLDGLGLHRSSSVSSSHITTGAALESSSLEDALQLYSKVILEAALTDEEFELSKSCCTDSVLALEDDPRKKVMLKLREKFYPQPLGASTVGEIEDINSLTAQRTKKLMKETFDPSGMIFALAGKYDLDMVKDKLSSCFSGMAETEARDIQMKNKNEKYTHIGNDGSQVHIGLMTETVTPHDENYYNARLAISVLAGGMSSRLFTEVREKRGLCYAVGASYHCLKQAAGFMAYSGTVPEKSQETFDVIISEFNRLKDGITQDELDIAKVGLKSALIMQSESTCSRASAVGSDYYILGRVRTLEEINEKIEQATVESVVDFLQANPFEDFTVVTIGPKEIKTA